MKTFTADLISKFFQFTLFRLVKTPTDRIGRTSTDSLVRTPTGMLGRTLSDDHVRTSTESVRLLATTIEKYRFCSTIACRSNLNVIARRVSPQPYRLVSSPTDRLGRTSTGRSNLNQKLLKLKFAFVAMVFFSCICFFNTAYAVQPDSIYMKNVHTVRLFQPASQISFPSINLNGNDRLELHFDDLDADVKNYYYTFELCNYDWTPSQMMKMEYVKGFSQNRITDYRFSSVALTRYTHYQVVFPQSNSYPTKSGNYMLRVYLDSDTSKVAFTRKFFVVEPLVTLVGKVTQPFAPKDFNTAQKVSFNVDLKGIKEYNAAQQTHVIVLQNFRWDNAIVDMKPAFIRGNSMEYNSETQGIFPAGKEWRWLDIRDFHLQTDRVLKADYNKSSTEIFLRPDLPWDGQRYMYFNDLNGMSSIEAVRGINPRFEGDYATVHFSYMPPNSIPYPNYDVYLFGQLTDYELTDSVRLRFNESKGLYETHMFLKQGYYDYTYLLKNKTNPADIRTTDGNYYETENIYTILVYYKPFGARADQLIGIALLNSRTDRPGMSF